MLISDSFSWNNKKSNPCANANAACRHDSLHVSRWRLRFLVVRGRYDRLMVAHKTLTLVFAARRDYLQAQFRSYERRPYLH